MARTLGSPLLSSPTFNLSANLGHPTFSHIPNPATCPGLGPCFHNTPGAVTHSQKPHSRRQAQARGRFWTTGQGRPAWTQSSWQYAPPRPSSLERSVICKNTSLCLGEGRKEGTRGQSSRQYPLLPRRAPRPCPSATPALPSENVLGVIISGRHAKCVHLGIRPF